MITTHDENIERSEGVWRRDLGAEGVESILEGSVDCSRILAEGGASRSYELDNTMRKTLEIEMENFLFFYIFSFFLSFRLSCLWY